MLQEKELQKETNQQTKNYTITLFARHLQIIQIFHKLFSLCWRNSGVDLGSESFPWAVSVTVVPSHPRLAQPQSACRLIPIHRQHQHSLEFGETLQCNSQNLS